MALSQPYAKSLIERFYKQYLGRDPVFGGPETASYWLKQLTEGTISIQDFEKSILSSDEYKQRNPYAAPASQPSKGTTSAPAPTPVAPQPKGSPSNTTGGPTGTKQPAATNQSMNETQARNIIKNKYNSILERDPIFGGQYSADWWIKGLMTGQETPESLENQLKLSNEYNFIIPAYKEKFGRLPSTSEIQSLNAGLRENNFAPKDLGNIIDLQAKLGPEASSSLAVKKYRQETLGNWDQPSQYTPPTGYSDNPSVKDTIIGMYKQVFGRTPAEEGLSYWTEQVNKGMTLNEVKKNLENSVEAKYIQPYFKDILGRAPTQADIDHYNNKFKTEGYNPDKFRKDLELSKENLKYDDRPFTYGNINQLTEVYRALLGREPDPEGLKYWQKDLERGVPMETIIKGFLDSPEKQAREAILAEKYKSNVQNIALQASEGPEKAQTFDTSTISDVGIMNPATVGQVSPQTPYANTSQTGPVGLASAPQVPQGSVETGQLQYEDPNKMWANQPATNQNLGQPPVKMFAEGGVVDGTLPRTAGFTDATAQFGSMDPSMLTTTNTNPALYTAGVPGQVYDPVQSAAHTMQASMSQPGVAATLQSMPTVQGQLSAGAIPGQVQGELSQGAFYGGATGQVTPDMLAQAAQGQLSDASLMQGATAGLSPEAQAQAAQGQLSQGAMAQAAQGQLSPEAQAQAAQGQLSQGALMQGATADASEKAMMQAAQGQLSGASQFGGAVMDPNNLGQLGLDAAQINQAQTVNEPADRALQTGELIDGTTVDMQRVKEDAGFKAAQGQPSSNATVQGQMANLMKDFEGDQTPAWAAGALRNATAQMQARGLGSSSIAGQALVQAAMEAAVPIAAQDASTFAQFGMQNLNNRQQAKLFAAEQRAKFLGIEFDQAMANKVYNATRITEIANTNYSTDVEIALENARMAQTVDLQNLGNRQAKVMADAAAITQIDVQNLLNVQNAGMQTAQLSAQMDFANLSNRQASASQNASTQAQMEMQSLQNVQAARSQNAQALANMDMANLSNEQQAVIANAQAAAQMDYQNLAQQQQAALQNAQAIAGMDMTNLSNQQQTALQNAANQFQMEAQSLNNIQQARSQNAQASTQMDYQNLGNQQQVALQNAQTAAQMGFTNLANLQAAGMQGAELVANMDFQNLQSRLTTAIETSKNFLQMDMANLDILNQQTMFKSKENINSILTDQAAENASKQFNATSKQQQQQFFDSLTSQVKQFNASQYNAMEQFNTGERNSMSRFNSDIQNQREMFNAQNDLIISQANAQWRQNIATLDMQAQNAANMEYAKFMNGMAAATLDQYWQRERDILDYTVNASENAYDRGLSIFMEDLRQQGQMAALDMQAEIEQDASKRAAWGRIAGTALDWGLEAISDAGWF